SGSQATAVLELLLRRDEARRIAANIAKLLAFLANQRWACKKEAVLGLTASLQSGEVREVFHRKTSEVIHISTGMKRPNWPGRTEIVWSVAPQLPAQNWETEQPHLGCQVAQQG